jgi:hypothetical protein
MLATLISVGVRFEYPDDKFTTKGEIISFIFNSRVLKMPV